MKNILLVDDEKHVLLSLAEGLGLYGGHFRVYTALRGEEAIEILDKKRIDLIVTDLNMPEMNGFELLEHVVRKFPHLPAIIMTAYSNPDIDRRLHSFGITYSLLKPVTYMELLESISTILDLKMPSGSGNAPASEPLLFSDDSESEDRGNK